MASKGFLGHTEPAAGVVSLTMAVTTLQNLAQLPIMHLRTLNPHVAAIMGAAPGSVTLPRQGGALAGANLQPCTGLSSFAFQGTNAHAVVEASTTAQASTTAGVPVSWRQQRQWVLPLAHCLIKHSLPGASPSKTTFACSLQQPALAFLWEHKVHDRSLFPGAGYFEMALAALRTLHIGSSNSNKCCLTQIAVPAPLVLAEPSDSAVGASVLTCSVDTASQAVVIASGPAQHAQTVHMRGHFAQLSKVTESRTEMRHVSASEALSRLLLSQEPGAQQPAAAAQALVAPAVATAQQDTGFWHHPARFDSFLQLGQLFLDSASDGIHVPAGVDCLSMPHKLDSAQAAYGHCQPSGTALSSNYALADQQAQICCQIQDMQARVILPAREAAPDAVMEEEFTGEVLYEMAWLTDSQQTLSSTAADSGSGCCSIRLGQQSPATACANAMAVLQDYMMRAPQSHMVLHGHGGTAHSQLGSFHAIAGLLRTAAAESKTPVHVLESAASQRSVGSMAPSAQRVQLSLQQTGSTADVFGKLMKANTAMVPRLLPSRAVSAPTAFSLMPQPRGALTNLKPVPLAKASMTKLQPGQVLLQVRAVGLNFRDVLNVLGMYPGDPGPPGLTVLG
jgi:acyl transferase domain-containing protein